MALMQSENAEGVTLILHVGSGLEPQSIYYLLLYDVLDSVWLDKISDDLAQSAGHS